MRQIVDICAQRSAAVQANFEELTRLYWIDPQAYVTDDGDWSIEVYTAAVPFYEMLRKRFEEAGFPIPKYLQGVW